MGEAEIIPSYRLNNMRYFQSNLANALLFQCHWFAAMLIGPLWAIPFFIMLGVQAFSKSTSQKKELSTWIVITFLGITVDHLLATIGAYTFRSGEWLVWPTLVPLWLVMMWMGFSMTVNHSLQWVFSRWWLPPVLFSIAGPLAYMGGSSLGKLELDQAHILWVAFVWCILGYALYRWNRYNEQTPPCYRIENGSSP